MNIPQIKANFRPLSDILYEGYAFNIIKTAMELGLFEAFAKRAMNAHSLAVKLGTVENLTEAFANALVALKILKKKGADYSLMPIAADFLVKSSPAYQGGMITMLTNLGQVTSQMHQILKKGAAKMPEADMLTNIEVIKDLGQGTMGGSIQDVTEFVVTLPEFSNLKHICDLGGFGGCHGFYTMALLDHNSQLRGTLCELPKVDEVAREIIAEMGYADRIDIISADIEKGDPIGEGYDLVFASNVLYMWKGHLEDIFKKINKAMVPGGVFVSNHMSMADDRCGPLSSTIMELTTQLIGYPTHHFSEGELKRALEASGFGNFTVKPAEEGRQFRSLILATRKF
jgi:predicted O-methyltransferase YrrM